MRARLHISAVIALLLACGGITQADELPAGHQSLLVLRVLAYDRNLKTRAKDTVTIVVAYKAGSSASEEARGGIVKALEELASKATVGGLPVRVMAVPSSDPASFESKLVAAHASALYVCPSLADSISAISAITRRRSIVTLAGTETYVKAGLSIGLAMRNSKATVVVNLTAAHAEGADLDAALLHVSEIIR